MVLDDTERARQQPKPPREMTREQRIGDLIYQLRDQCGTSCGYKWHDFDVFGDGDWGR